MLYFATSSICCGLLLLGICLFYDFCYFNIFANFDALLYLLFVVVFVVFVCFKYLLVLIALGFIIVWWLFVDFGSLLVWCSLLYLASFGYLACLWISWWVYYACYGFGLLLILNLVFYYSLIFDWIIVWCLPVLYIGVLVLWCLLPCGVCGCCLTIGLWFRLVWFVAWCFRWVFGLVVIFIYIWLVVVVVLLVVVWCC